LLRHVLQTLDDGQLMQRLELKVPPVVLALVCVAAMWCLSRWLPALDVPIPLRRTIATAWLMLGAAVGAGGVAAFRRSRTTVDPTRPDRASALVATGVYRVTRNPMYVAMAFGMVGVAVWLANAGAMLVIALFLAWITRLQIVPEERALRAKFGADYDGYASRVRRWL
jgi:protein-S-isoprenylcysteine O-methyltransferase Ste14